MQDNPDAGKSGAFRCPDCFLTADFCCCDKMLSVTNSIPIHIIRHNAETYKTSNTARLAYRALSVCHLYCWGAIEPSQLPSFEGAWLLFPPQLDHDGLPHPDGPPVHDLADGAPDPYPTMLVVVDGTWGQARRMSHRIPQVSRLPRLVCSQSVERERARKAPRPGTMATLEAIGWALHALEGPAVGEPLLECFDRFVAAFRKQCGKP